MGELLSSAAQWGWSAVSLRLDSPNPLPPALFHFGLPQSSSISALTPFHHPPSTVRPPILLPLVATKTGAYRVAAECAAAGVTRAGSCAGAYTGNGTDCVGIEVCTLPPLLLEDLHFSCCSDHLSPGHRPTTFHVLMLLAGLNSPCQLSIQCWAER